MSTVFHFAQIDRLIVAVEDVYKQSNKRLLDMMFGKYKLFQHFVSLKKYMLMGQGDFIRCLLIDLE